MEFLHKRNIDYTSGYQPENIKRKIEEECRFGSYEFDDSGKERYCKGHFRKLYNAFQEDENVIIWLMDTIRIYGYTKIEKVENTYDRGLNFFFSKKKEDLFIFEEPLTAKKVGLSLPISFSIKELKIEEMNKLAVFKKED